MSAGFQILINQTDMARSNQPQLECFFRAEKRNKDARVLTEGSDSKFEKMADRLNKTGYGHCMFSKY